MARTQGSHSDVTGPRVRAAALSLFAKHGYAAVSMRKIAAEVGVQAGALYNYTPDKQSLLFDLMKGHMDELLAACNVPEATNDPMGELEEFSRFHIRFHSQKPDEVFIAYMELRNLNPENFSVIEELRRRYEQHLEYILIRGVSNGVFCVAETKITSMAIIAMLTGVNTWFRETGRLTLDDIEQTYWTMVHKMVAA